MNEYTIYFTILSKKMKVKIIAETEQKAKEMLHNAIKIDKIIEKNFVVDFFEKNIFKK